MNFFFGVITENVKEFTEFTRMAVLTKNLVFQQVVTDHDVMGRHFIGYIVLYFAPSDTDKLIYSIKSRMLK